MKRRFLLAGGAATSVVGPADAQTITGITLSNQIFPGNAPSGTLVGVISVSISSGVFAGSLMLTGPNASSFAISGSNLVTNGVVPTGSYSVTITATQQCITYSVPFTLTGTIESQAGSSISAPGQTLIVSTTPGTAGSGASIGITSGAQVSYNGTTATGTSGVVKIVYIDHCAFQENNAGNYYGPIASATSTGPAPLTNPLPLVVMGASTIVAGSPSGTVIGPITVTTGLPSGTIGTGAYTWTLAWSGSASVAISGSNLVTVGTLGGVGTIYTGTISATNAQVLGSPFTLPKIFTVTSAGVQAPAQAQAVGYNTRVGGFEATDAVLYSADSSGATVAPFYTTTQDEGNWAPSPGNITTGSNGLTLNTVQNNNYGGGLSAATGARDSGPDYYQSTHSAAPVNGVPPVNNGFGICYGYGYFEAQIETSLTNANGSGANHYPTFWLNSNNQTQDGYLEIDIFEIYNGNPYGQPGIWNSTANTGGVAIPTAFSNTGGNYYPPDVSPTQPEVYGVLYTPNEITYYYNNVKGISGSMTANQSFNTGGNYVPNNLLGTNPQFMNVYLGTTQTGTWPVTYNWVRIWQ